MTLAADTPAMALPPQAAATPAHDPGGGRRDAPAAWIDAAIALFPGPLPAKARERRRTRNDDGAPPQTHT